MKKLFVFDMDGTLLNKSGVIPDVIASFLNRLDHNEYGFTIATGRSNNWTEPWLKSLNLRLPIISCGGACIKDLAGGQILFESPMEIEVLESLARIARRHGVEGLTLVNPDETAAEASISDRMEPYANGLHLAVLDDILSYEKTAVKMDMIGEMNVLSKVRKEIYNYVGRLSIYGQSWLEITNSGVDKGSALIKLGHLLGMDPAKMVVFGDDYNDLPMFTSAGTAVAMADSPEEVRISADLIVPANDEIELIKLTNSLLL